SFSTTTAFLGRPSLFFSTNGSCASSRATFRGLLAGIMTSSSRLPANLLLWRFGFVGAASMSTMSSLEFWTVARAVWVRTEMGERRTTSVLVWGRQWTRAERSTFMVVVVVVVSRTKLFEARADCCNNAGEYEYLEVKLGICS